MIDVVILYEHRTRDLENACLLAAKIESKGFLTRIYNIYEPCKNDIKSKVVIVPHLYNDDQLYSFCRQGDSICPCIIDMQYEQVLCEADLDGIHTPSGQAVFAYHLSWGRAQTERYLKGGITKDRVIETGHVGMDLLRPRYLDYFNSREDLAKEFGLDYDKPWIMFLSSFSYCNLSEEILLHYESMFSETRRLAKLSDKSLAEMIRWFKKFVEDNPDKILIYRPHPAEHVSEKLLQLQDAFKNFRIISKYSIRQWMNPIDVFWNWYSTSVIDTYFAGKPCYTLRPFEFPKELDVEILVGSETIKTYDDLKDAMLSKQIDFPVDSNIIEYFYGKKYNKEASDKILDLVQDFIKGDKLGYHYDIEALKENQANHGIIKRLINRMMFSLAVKYDLTKLGSIFKAKKKDFAMYKKDILGYRREVKSYKEKFIRVLK